MFSTIFIAILIVFCGGVALPWVSIYTCWLMQRVRRAGK